LRSLAAKFRRVAGRLLFEGREPDWRARSGRVWVSKVAFIAVGEAVERTSALMAAILM
jgi:hypothetical protein